MFANIHLVTQISAGRAETMATSSRNPLSPLPVITWVYVLAVGPIKGFKAADCDTEWSQVPQHVIVVSSVRGKWLAITQSMHTLEESSEVNLYSLSSGATFQE